MKVFANLYPLCFAERFYLHNGVLMDCMHILKQQAGKPKTMTPYFVSHPCLKDILQCIETIYVSLQSGEGYIARVYTSHSLPQFKLRDTKVNSKQVHINC